MPDMILLGYTHTDVIGTLHPEIAYPTRKVRSSPFIITTIRRDPCTCPDEHVELWIQPRVVEEQLKLFY